MLGWKHGTSSFFKLKEGLREEKYNNINNLSLLIDYRAQLL